MNTLRNFCGILICILFFSCDNDDDFDNIDFGITSFDFLQADNPKLLLNDVECRIDNGEITTLIPYIIKDSLLIAHFEFVGERILVNGIEQKSGVSINDFSKPVEYVVVNASGEEKHYIITISCFTKLPVLFIETEDGSAISSKNEYKNATICIWGDSLPFNSDVKIKGRGNSTWTLPKKPYKLKFPEKVSLLGAPKDKEWVLLANYADKTNLRNETAFYMGRISQLEWTPRTHFVEVFINDVYEGTYQLCEQVKVSTSRVDVTDDGFLLEIDHLDKLDATDTYFETERILVNIKKPDVEVGDEKYCFIKEYITEAERVLFGDNFKDPANGYRKYLDVNSFVDWYLVNEIAKNNDAVFWSSCYMNVSPNGKIKMGPLWDFDIAFGNINYNNNQLATGFWVKEASWIKRLFEDTYFVDKVKERFKYFMERKEDIFMYINKTADTLHYSAIENNNQWGTLYSNTWPNYAVWGAYENEVQYMKFWLDKRFLWLDKAFEDE